MKYSRLEIDVSALAGNIAALRGLLRPETDILFVVKANAYGHGIRNVARAAWASGIRAFAVISLERALELRKMLPRASILLLGLAEADDAQELLAHRITTIIAHGEQAAALSVAAGRLGGRLEAHLKIDSGMGRLGIRWPRAAGEIRNVCGLPGLRVTGIMSHVAHIEPGNMKSAETQVRRFFICATEAEKCSGRPLRKHLSSSAPMLLRPDWDMDFVRPGLFLYGYGGGSPGARARSVPILQWKGEVVQVKRVPAGAPVGYEGLYRTRRATDIGIVNVGYADGYRRNLGAKGHVLVGGRRRPLAGRISMNWIALDLGPHSGIRAGDEAVLIGRQDREEIWADELAACSGTIAYEILSGIHPSVPRFYVNGPRRDSEINT